MKQILENKNRNHQNVLILGSGRVPKNFYFHEKISKGSKRTCLVTPEANLRECLLLFALTLGVSEKTNFIWRMPPMIEFKQVVGCDKKFNFLSKNISISCCSLEMDIRKSDFVLYRGSSVSINCTSAGLMPIYYSLVNEFTIDPLYNLDKGRHIVGNHMDLEHVLGLPISKKIQKEISSYAQQIYSPLNVDILKSLK